MRNIFKSLLAIITLSILLVSTAIYGIEEEDVIFDDVLKVDMPCLTTIIKDQDGFIWFTTQNGLVRFDGYQTMVFKTGENSISNDYLGSVFEDSQGIIWVGTQGGGLDRYDKDTDTFTHYKNDPDNQESLISDIISINKQAIFEDSNGYLWIATDKGLEKFDPETEIFSHYQYDENNDKTINNNMVWSVTEDLAGNIWVGTASGLNKLDVNTEIFTRYEYNPENTNSIGPGWVFTILPDEKEPEVLWLALIGGGLIKFDTSTGIFKQYLHPEGQGDDQAISMIQYGEELWIGWFNQTAGGGGISVFDKKSETYKNYRYDSNKSQGIASSIIYSMMVDDTGIIWVLNHQGALQKVDPYTQNFKLYTANNSDQGSISANGHISYYEDSEGIIWMGSLSTGLERFDPNTGTFKNYIYKPDDPTSIASNFVSRIYEDSEGLFWIGTRGGFLQLFDRELGQVVKTYSHNPEDPTSIGGNDTIRYILEDPDDSSILWIGSFLGGFHKFDKESETFYNYPINQNDETALNSNSIAHIMSDDEGYLWLSTNGGGLLRFDRNSETFQRYLQEDTENSLPSNFIWEVQQYEKDILWIATVGGGLVKYNKSTDTFKVYDKTVQFPANTILTIRQDDDGYLWLGTDEGLVQFDPVSEVSKVYTKADGLQGNVFLDAAALYTRSGDMWIGGMNGVNRFNPMELVSNENIPNIVLTSMKQGGESMSLGVAPERVETVEIPWRDNYFEFTYAALNYSLSEKNQYMYMLEGFDKDWYYAGTKRFGRYSGLKPGTYTLRIKGSNNDGVWNEEGVFVKIVIKPPFYRSTPFIVIMVILIVVIVLGTFQWRIVQSKRNERILEQLVSDRTRELEEKAEEENALNEELIALNEELIASNEQLTDMQKVLVQTEKMSALGNLVAGLAHEINTPIGIGVTASSNLSSLTKDMMGALKKHPELEEDIVEYIEDIGESATIIEKNLSKAGKLVKNFKLVATDQSVEQVRKFYIKEYLDEILLSHSPMLQKSNIEVTVTCEEKLEVVTDPGVFSQVISNLVMNSILHAFDDMNKGSIKINIYTADNTYHLSYYDNGVGMDEETVNHLFEPFYTTRRANGGTGLGMYIVYNIIKQQYKGKIECESVVGEGTTFRISWPKP